MGQSRPRKLRLHIVTQTTSETPAYERIARFYEANRSPGNRVRPPITMLAIFEHHGFHVVEDSDTQEIVAIGGILDHELSNTLLREAGATRVVLNGYRLQRILHWTRAVFGFVMDPPDVHFSVVASWNGASLHNTVESGFGDWDPPNELLAKLGHAREDVLPLASLDPPPPEGSPGKTFLRFDRDRLDAVRDRLLELKKSGVIEGPDGSHVEIDIDIPILSELDPREPLMPP